MLNLTLFPTVPQVEKQKDAIEKKLEQLQQRYNELGITYDWGDVSLYDQLSLLST